MEATILKEKPTEGRAPGGVSVELLIKRAIEDDNPVKVYDELVPLLALLSPGEYAAAKTELREHFKRRLSLVDLEKAVKDARKSQKRAKFTSQARSTEPGQAARPVVEIGRQFYLVVHDSLKALELANKRALTEGGKDALYIQSGRLVTISFDCDGINPTIVTLSESSLRFRLSLAAEFVTVRETEQDTKVYAVDPPKNVVLTLLSMRPQEWPFPEIKGLTDLPIPRSDGSILDTPGYDVETKICYIPGRAAIPAIPKNPTQEEIAAALALLYEPLRDFPFTDEPSRTTMLATELTIALRPVIKSVLPVLLINATTQGTGKTLLGFFLGMLAMGRQVAAESAVESDEEWRKKMVASLLSGDSVVLIDNVLQTLESGSLNSALTSPLVKDRLLGHNDQWVTVENRALWIVTGNHLQIGQDMRRRCVLCNLNADMERPETRNPEDFHIPELISWTEHHRGELIGAALTLYRAWHLAGRPRDKSQNLASFQSWAEIIGGILYMTRVPGFLGNLEDNNHSPVKDEWRAFVVAMHETFEEHTFTCFELAKKIKEDESLRETLPGQFSDSFDRYQRGNGETLDFPTHLGNAFKNYNGNWFGELCFKKSDKFAKGRKAQWQVISRQAVDVSTHQEQPTEGQAETPSRQGQESKEETARKLLNWIEENGGRVSSASNGAVLLTMPVNYPDKLWKQLNARVKSLSLQICQIKNWPVDTGTID